jgi:hypothetical protein
VGRHRRCRIPNNPNVSQNPQSAASMRNPSGHYPVWFKPTFETATYTTCCTSKCQDVFCSPHAYDAFQVLQHCIACAIQYSHLYGQSTQFSSTNFTYRTPWKALNPNWVRDFQSTGFPLLDAYYFVEMF